MRRNNPMELIGENPELVGLIASLGTLVTGIALLLDDIKDFGKDGTERNPPRPHHYMYGAITLVGGVAGVCASGLTLLKKTKPIKIKRIPPSLLEQGVPLEIVEKLR